MEEFKSKTENFGNEKKSIYITLTDMKAMVGSTDGGRMLME